VTRVRFSLTFYILSALSCLLVLTWLLLSLISFKTSEKDLIAQKLEEGRLQVASIAELLPRPLAVPEPGAPAARYLTLLGGSRGFGGMLVLNISGRQALSVPEGQGSDPMLQRVLQDSRESHQISADGRIIRCYGPILTKGNVVGAVRLTLSLAAEQERLKSSRRTMLAYFVLDFLLLLVIGSFLMSRSVVTPIRRLVSMTRRIEAGDLGGLVQVPGSTEVAELSDAFNKMVLALGRKRDEVEEKVASLNRANQELIEARSETVRSEKMASIGLLAAGMAHEIGTPLAAIMGYTGILADELAEDPEKADYLRRIAAESSRIDRIVRGLLDYARPKPVLQEEVALRQLIEQTVELLQAQGALKLLRVTVKVQEGLPLLSADPHQLQQLLINLILNARDAMPEGGDLWIRGQREGDQLLLEVIDNGQGMPPEQLSRVFDPFFTTKEPGKGTGLGLAIVARIAESCGGKISVQSEVGKGSRFVVRLPIYSARVNS
jgi:two-component system, NtrC family, sensor kinase